MLIKYAKNMRIFFPALIAVFFGSTISHAIPPGWPEFVSGDFEEARKKGQQHASADGYAHACRTGLVLGGFLYRDKASIEALHTAINDCDKALRLNPQHYFAKMSLAIGLSFEGKRLKRPSYPKRAKAYIEELIDQEPHNPLGYGALAAWHSEVSAAGFFARITLGARRKYAKKNFEKALKMGAVDYALKFEYVKYLARGNKAERQKAVVSARQLLNEPTLLALDEILHERCRHLLQALENNNKRQLKKALKESTAFQYVVTEHEKARFPLEQLVALHSE